MISILYVPGVLLLVFFNSSSCFLFPDGIQKVNTKYGDIIGLTDHVTFDNQTYPVRKFLGIPYAEPPVGNLRFKKPIMKRNLSSPFVAQQYGPRCPQLNNNNYSMSEDCLYLNIFTPTNVDTGSKHVMIWVHGGGFRTGASNQYVGDVISVFNDVIVVTINYRLGALGFFSTNDENAKGNYGLWDQHLAFRWVYENIGDFGGDNANMTIFGQSAGATAVVYQMMYPGNEGIFKRVIAESGTLEAWGLGNGNANYESSLNFGRMLGCNETNHSKLVACLRQKNQADIVSAAEEVLKIAYNEVNVSWVPVYDNEFVPAKTNNILNELVDSSLQDKYHSFRSFDLMIGANNYDGYLFLALAQYQNTDINLRYLFGEYVTDYVIPRTLEARFGETPSSLALELTEEEYTVRDDPTNITMRMISVVKLYTDYAVTAPTIKTAKSHASTQSNTYVYQFSKTSPASFSEIPHEILNEYTANHGDELMFVFGFRLNVLVSQGRLLQLDRVTPEDVHLSKAMMTMWTNFAKSGNPNYPTSLQPLYDVRWPAFDSAGESYLEINDKLSPLSVKQRLAARSVEFWNNLLPKVQMFAKSHS